VKITEDVDGTTVGAVAAFIAHALRNGAALDAPLHMSRNRNSTITAMTIDLTLPGFARPGDAADALSADAPKAPRRPSSRDVTTVAAIQPTEA
jgi:hypothetical protein